MDEAEWLACANPDAMLTFIKPSGQLSQRKARLFACAAARRLWKLLNDERYRKAVEISERFADGEIIEAERDSASMCFNPSNRSTWDSAARAAYHAAAWGHDFPHYSDTFFASRSAWGCREVDKVAEQLAQADLLRDIVGPLPFRPVAVAPAVFCWNGGTVGGLAEAAYEDRFKPTGTLHLSRLAILADALEDAGCAEPGLVAHLRSPGAHVRGCWALDALLGKS